MVDRVRDNGGEDTGQSRYVLERTYIHRNTEIEDSRTNCYSDGLPVP